MNFDDRRKWKRKELSGKVEFKVSKDGELQQGLMQNIGAGGIGMLIETRIVDRLPLTIIFNLPDDSGNITAIGIIMWIRSSIQKEKEVYQIGVKFTEINEADRKRIIDFVEKSGEFLTEKRAFKRYELNGSVKFRVNKELDVGMIRDIGRGGVNLLIKKPIFAGTEVKIQFEIPKTTISFVAAGEVVWCQRTKEKWVESYSIGIKFTKVDEASIKKLIGYAEKKK